MKRTLLSLGAGLSLFMLLACGETGDQATDHSQAAGGPAADSAHVHAAVARLQSGPGYNVTGTVTFEHVEGDRVRVTAHISGLTPGAHGFHIHETGDCSAPDFTSAGGHFNPTAAQHGDPAGGEHHTGDLGNLEADAAGEAHLDTTVDFLSLEGEHTIVGKAVVVHADPDDLRSQPTGNAGGRVACGVIENSR